MTAAVTSSHRAPPEPLSVPPRVLRWSLSVLLTVLLLNLMTDAGRLTSKVWYGDVLASSGQQEVTVKKAAGRAALLAPLAADYRYLF
ncbi:MAG: hypothetical protein GWN58_19320, partial [Anaerolineae bacterium]|nr:hypothetical protein [Anaerolineae bacterium]